MDFRAYIRHLGAGKRILEIGPSYNPIFPKGSGADIWVMDHAPKEELVAKYTAFGIDISQIGDVDFVTTDLSDVVAEGHAFDLIVASHLIEHATDIIEFFKNCESALSVSGKIALIVPDKRFSFDYFRPLSTPGQMIDAYLSGRKLHLGALYDHYSYFCRRDGQMAWWDKDAFDPEFIHSSATSREPLDRVLRTGEYEDAHEWVFTPASFRFIINELRQGEFMNFGIEEFFGSIGFEFMTTLSRTAPADLRSKKEQLLEVESDIWEVAQYRQIERASK